MVKRRRKPRTSVRVFSRPEFLGTHILVGVHKSKKLAEKQRDKIGRWRLSSSKIKRTKRGYKLFVRYK